MIHTLGDYKGASRDLEGNLIISFCINDDLKLIEKLEKLKDEELTIEVDKFRSKRSLNANAYFWKLCDQIARALGSDKDTIYLLQLSKYGIFEDVRVIKEAEEHIRNAFRYVDDLTEGDSEYKDLRCYIGSSQYNTKEMSDLINGTVNDAKDLGIDTWSKEELDALVKAWKGES